MASAAGSTDGRSDATAYLERIRETVVGSRQRAEDATRRSRPSSAYARFSTPVTSYWEDKRLDAETPSTSRPTSARPPSRAESFSRPASARLMRPPSEALDPSVDPQRVVYQQVRLGGARWVTLRARWVTLRARWVVLRARWVTVRARWVTRRARWVTRRARWMTLKLAG
jgi:hypothetical protein